MPYSHIEKLEAKLERVSIPSKRSTDILHTARKHNSQVKPDTPALRLMASGIRNCLWCYWQYASGLGNCREILQRQWQQLAFRYCHSCQQTILRVALRNVHKIPPQFSAFQLTINKIKGCYQLPEPQLTIVLVQIVLSPLWHSFSKPVWKSRGQNAQN